MGAASISDPIVLPNWTDPTSVATFIISAFAMVAGLLAATHVIIPAGISTAVQGWSSVAGFLVAGVAAAINQWRITTSHKTAITAGHPTAVVLSARQQRSLQLGKGS